MMSESKLMGVWKDGQGYTFEATEFVPPGYVNGTMTRQVVEGGKKLVYPTGMKVETLRRYYTKEPDRPCPA